MRVVSEISGEIQGSKLGFHHLIWQSYLLDHNDVSYTLNRGDAHQEWSELLVHEAPSQWREF